MASGRTPRAPGRPGPAPAPRAVDAGDSLRYIETSALLAALLEKDRSARQAIRRKGRRITSALTFAESTRSLVRARVSGRISPEQERAALRWLKSFRRRCDVISITESVLVRAGRPYPAEPIRTLDAIHLASAEELGESPQLVTIVSRDARVRDNAHALGYPLG